MFNSSLAKYRFVHNNDAGNPVNSDHADKPDGYTVRLCSGGYDEVPSITARVFQGCYVNACLYDFICAVRDKLRGVEFAVVRGIHDHDWVYYRHNRKGVEDSQLDQHTIYHSVALRYPNSTANIGVIGYCDIRRNTSGARQNRYWVHTPHIVNGKYAYHSLQYNLTASKNMATTLRSVAKYVRRANDTDILELSVRNCNVGDIIRNGNYELRRDSNQAIDRVSRKVLPLMQALREHWNNGTPMPSEFTELMDDALDKFNTFKEASERAVSGTHVFKQELPTGVRFIVTPLPDLTRVRDNVCDPTTIQYYNEDQLPEELMGKVSMCMLAGVDNYVPEVGVMLSHDCVVVENSNASE